MKIGLIGCGNLGSSLVKGFLKAGSVSAGELIAGDIDENRLKELQALGVETTTDNKKVVAASDVIFIAVKPDTVGEVLDGIKGLSSGKLLISVAAGVSTEFIEERTDARVIRAMPNICCLVSEMASCFCLGTKATEKDEKLAERLLGSVGRTFKVEEERMDAITGLSGSGPAYFYLVIKALEGAGVELGLPKDIALKLAAQTAKGAGEMALQAGKEVEGLIESVCSKKGTTIEGLKVLEKQEVSEAFKDAVRAATKRAKELSR